MFEQVLSNAERMLCADAAVILYPALGAPEVLSRSRSDQEWIHLLMLLPDVVDVGSLQRHINAHLRLFSSLESLRKAKDKGEFEGQSNSLVGDPQRDIQLIKYDPHPKTASSNGSHPKTTSSNVHPWQLEAQGWKGILHEGILERYKKVKELNGCAVWEVAVDPLQLQSPWLEAWAMGKVFLHWGCTAAAEDAQSSALYEILAEAKYRSQPYASQTSAAFDMSLFVGERLQKDLSPDGDSHLWKGLDLTQLGNQTSKDKSQAEQPVYNLMDVHPVYDLRPAEGQAKKPLRLGFISDLHLVNKFRLLKNCDLYPLPKGGAESGRPTGLKTIGHMVQDTVEVLANLFGKLKDADVDAVIIGGDLVDFCEDNWPKYKAGLCSPQDIECAKTNAKSSLQAARRFEHVWDSCCLDDKPLLRDDNQQAGTTMLGLFHMILSKLVATTNKPVYVLAGNHDAYQAPFGISPRVDVGDLEVARGNEGIAADCNLTIHEAVLAFGKDYGRIFQSFNFNPKVKELFHLLFSPLCSWTAAFGDHQLLFLDWGDDEAMLGHQNDKFGHLPHATESCSDADITLVNWAVGVGKSGERPVTAFSHYTWACYDPSIPIDDQHRNQSFASTEKLSVSDQYRRERQGFKGLNDPEVTPYNVGTCRKGRTAMFEHFRNGDIRLAVSGHAHRASLYVLETSSSESDAHVCAWHFDEAGWKDPSRTEGSAIFVVSDSAGPIPRENRGLLEGWGSSKASWTYLEIDSTGRLQAVESIATDATNSVPRLAVSLDYVEFKHCGGSEVIISGGLRTRIGSEKESALAKALHPSQQPEKADSTFLKQGILTIAAPAPAPSAEAIAKEQQRRAKAVCDKADAAKATLEQNSSSPTIDPVASLDEPLLQEAREHFGYDSKILSNFVSEPISHPDKLSCIRFYHNAAAIALPAGVSIDKVSLFVWEGMEVEMLKDTDPALKKSWLSLKKGGRPGEWIAESKANSDSWSALTSILSDGERSHASSLFLCFEFSGSAKGYDTTTSWVVYGQWEDDWVNGKLGRRIRIFRNVVAHENPDHEIWRLAEYEADAKLGSLGDVK